MHEELKAMVSGNDYPSPNSRTKFTLPEQPRSNGSTYSQANSIRSDTGGRSPLEYPRFPRNREAHPDRKINSLRAERNGRSASPTPRGMSRMWSNPARGESAERREKQQSSVEMSRRNSPPPRSWSPIGGLVKSFTSNSRSGSKNTIIHADSIQSGVSRLSSHRSQGDSSGGDQSPRSIATSKQHTNRWTLNFGFGNNDRTSVDLQDILLDLYQVEPQQAEQKSRCRPCKGAWLYPELPWGAPPAWEKNHHRGAKFLACWDIATFLCCLFVAASVPYTVGFGRGESNGCVFDWNENTSQYEYIMSYMDISVDCVFTLDIILNFHTAIWVISTEGTPHWILVDDLKHIRKLYLKGAFVSDLLGQIPWQYLDCIFPDANALLKVLRLLRLLKLLRLHRIRRILQALYRKFPKSEFLITCAELVLTMCMVAHWMCCVWFRVGYPHGWTYFEGIVDENGVDTDPSGTGWAFEWVTSFYWAITTMTTIGYGDIVGKTTTERAVASVVMVLGCALFAWTTSRLTYLVTKSSICKSNFEHKMEELNEYMAARAISPGLVKKTKSYYMLKFPTQRIFHEEAILKDLPVDLRKEFCLELYKDVVGMAPLFKACSKEVQREICFKLRPVYKEAGRDITSQGQVPDAMYIVRFGHISIMCNRELLMTGERGTLFGENAILGLTRNMRRSRTVVADTMCELCMLRADDFRELLVNYPDFQEVVARMTKRFVHFLDVSLHHNRDVSNTALHCVDWDLMSRQVIMEKEHNARARRHSQINLQMVPEHFNTPKRPLKTALNLRLHSFERMITDIPKGTRAFLSISWDGNEGLPVARAESEMFELKVDSKLYVKVRKTIDLALLHLNSDWDTYPPVRVALCRLRAKGTGVWRQSEPSGNFSRSATDATMASTDSEDSSWGFQQFKKNTMARLNSMARAGSSDEEQKLNGTSIHSQLAHKGSKANVLNKSLKFLGVKSPWRMAGKDGLKDIEESGSDSGGEEDFVEIFVGYVPITQLIANRIQAKTYPRVTMSLDSLNADTPSVESTLSCKVTRILYADSTWHSVLNRIRTRPQALSKFFKERREKQIGEIGLAIKGFNREIVKERRSRRIQLQEAAMRDNEESSLTTEQQLEELLKNDTLKMEQILIVMNLVQQNDRKLTAMTKSLAETYPELRLPDDVAGPSAMPFQRAPSTAIPANPMFRTASAAVLQTPSMIGFTPATSKKPNEKKEVIRANSADALQVGAHSGGGETTPKGGQGFRQVRANAVPSPSGSASEQAFLKFSEALSSVTNELADMKKQQDNLQENQSQILEFIKRQNSGAVYHSQDPMSDSAGPSTPSAMGRRPPSLGSISYPIAEISRRSITEPPNDVDGTHGSATPPSPHYSHGSFRDKLTNDNHI